MGTRKQLWLLLWKNWLMQRRQLLWTLSELALPVLLSAALVVMRQQVVSVARPASIYPAWTVSGDYRDLLRRVGKNRILADDFPFCFRPNRVLFAPLTPLTNKLMKSVARRYTYKVFSMNTTGFLTEEEVVTALIRGFDAHSMCGNEFLGGVIFDAGFANGGALPAEIRYKIRLSNVQRNRANGTDEQQSRWMEMDQGWDTQYTYPTTPRLGPRHGWRVDGGEPGYWREAFLTLQRAVDAAITQLVAPAASARLAGVRVRLRRFPYPAFVDNPFVVTFQRQWPLIMMISLLVSVLYTTRNVVREKEGRLHEYMRVMGLNGWLHWLAHFVSSLAKLSVVCGAVTALLCVDVGGQRIVDRTDPLLLFCFLLLYATSAICYSFAVSAFFGTGNAAAACAGVVWVALYVPYFFLQPRYGDLTFRQKLLASLSPNTAMAFGAQVIGTLEGQGVGLRWPNLAQPATVEDGFTMAHVLVGLLVDSAACLLLVGVVEVARLTVPVKLLVRRRRTILGKQTTNMQPNGGDCHSRPCPIEPLPSSSKVHISIERLSKAYGSGDSRVDALSDLSLQTAAGQVTAILGHNGAGKSTLLAVLTGLTPPSSGHVQIGGDSVRSSMREIRNNMGFCPQFNALFDQLTVHEHLTFYCMLKGRPSDDAEVRQLLSALNLWKKRHSLAATLSGGMQRKRSASATDAVERLLRRHCDLVQMDARAANEITYHLPSTHRDRFEALFADLERNQAALGVSSFGIAITTMEEVFLKVDRNAKTQLAVSASVDDYADVVTAVHPQTAPNYDFRSKGRVVGFRLQAQHLRAMLAKKAIHSARHWRILVAQLFIPVVFVCLAVLVNRLLPTPDTVPPFNLNLHPFGKTLITIGLNDSDPLAEQLFNSYASNAMRDDAVSFVKTGERRMADFLLGEYARRGAYTLDRRMIVGARFASNESTGRVDVTALFNNQPLHSAAVALNLVGNALLRLASGANLSIATVNAPLPPGAVDRLQGWVSTGVAEFNMAFNLLVGVSFLCSSFVVLLVDERRSNAKHLQLLSGLHPTVYWLASYLFDALAYLTTALALLALFFAFDLKLLTADGRWAPVLLLLVAFGWAALPMTYAASFFFSSTASAFVMLTVCNVFSGLATLTLNTMLLVLGLEQMASSMEWLFLALSPNFCLGQGFQSFYINSFLQDGCKPIVPFCAAFNQSQSCGGPFSFCCGDGYAKDSLAWGSPGIGRMPVFLVVHGLFFWAVVAALEVGLFRRLTHLARKLYRRRTVEAIVEGNEEAVDEWRRGSRLSECETPLVARSLTKRYGHFCAVDAIHLRVQRGECFGLLGVNGAGKTTTFEMLAGLRPITAGSASIAGVDVQRGWRRAARAVGFCPQFDALIDQLTGAETLTMFCRLRGVPESEIGALRLALARAVGIESCIGAQVGTYSGGNKRRLSVAVALVGQPPVLLLDEPTSGVDPAARRSIWALLAAVRQAGAAIVLTSHCMDECEALCTRLAIMVDGRFKCLGSPQQIKSKHGAGYTLQLTVADDDALPAARQALSDNFAGSRLLEVNHTRLYYELPRVSGGSLSHLFGTLQQLVTPLRIVDYSLSQTTLEQVFVSLSNQGRRNSDTRHDVE